MKRIILSLLILVGGVTSSMAGVYSTGNGANAAPATTNITLEAPEQVIFKPQGSETSLASVNVAAQYVGFTCSTLLTSVSLSVHPGNNIRVTSGSDSVMFNNIERTPGTLTLPGDSIVLGNTVSAALIMGPDEAYSAAFTVKLSCVERTIEVCREGKVTRIGLSERRPTDTDVPCPVPEIEVCRAGVPTTIREDQREETDTDLPCPVEQIKVCRNGQLKIIDVDERKSTDTELPCPVPEEKINVCRNNAKITILASQRKPSDKDVPATGTCVKPQPQVQSAVTTERTVLPNTGASSLIAATSITGIGGAIAHQIRIRRR